MVFVFWYSSVNLVFSGLFLLNLVFLVIFYAKKLRCRIQKCKIWQMVLWGQKKSDHPGSDSRSEGCVFELRRGQIAHFFRQTFNTINAKGEKYKNPPI